MHIIGIPEVLIGLYQLFTKNWTFGLLNFFIGYLLQWIGHAVYEKNELGEILLIRKIVKGFLRR